MKEKFTRHGNTLSRGNILIKGTDIISSLYSRLKHRQWTENDIHRFPQLFSTEMKPCFSMEHASEMRPSSLWPGLWRPRSSLLWIWVWIRAAFAVAPSGSVVKTVKTVTLRVLGQLGQARQLEDSSRIARHGWQVDFETLSSPKARRMTKRRWP